MFENVYRYDELYKPESETCSNRILSGSGQSQSGFATLRFEMYPTLINRAFITTLFASETSCLVGSLPKPESGSCCSPDSSWVQEQVFFTTCSRDVFRN